MMTVEVTITIDVPDGIGTTEQLEEWLEFELGYNGSCSGDNPYMLKVGKVSAQSISVDEW